MPEYKTDDLINFAGTGQPAKFGDAFGQMMSGKVNAGVDAIRQIVAAKLGGLDPTGESGDGAEEGGNRQSTPDDIDTEMELTADEIVALDTDNPEVEV
jgi:hypothetical protein